MRRVAALVIAPILAVAACGRPVDEPGAVAPVAPPLASPMAVQDGAPVVLSGLVGSADPNAFVLSYAGGAVTVEVDDWDRFHEGGLLQGGEYVTVFGRLDADLLEQRKLEAESVYVHGRNTFYHADGADEEAARTVLPPARSTGGAPAVGTYLELAGRVAEVDGRAFRLDAAGQQLSVDTAGMSYDPMDEIGYQRIRIGDRVRVGGVVESGLFTEKRLAADSVITLAAGQRGGGLDLPPPAEANTPAGELSAS
jgi:uncharacterized protein YdeI (BOF family)